MSVLVFAESKEGKFKKTTLEALTYGADLAAALGMPCQALVMGKVDEAELAQLGRHGADAILRVEHADLEKFSDAYPAAVSAAAQQQGAQVVVVSHTYNGRHLAPRVAARLDAAFVAGATTLAEKAGEGLRLRKTGFSGKAVEEVELKKLPAVITVKNNSYKVKENAKAGAVQPFQFAPRPEDLRVLSKETKKAGDKISLQEAEVVVSAGRGIGSEANYAANWKSVGELADLLGAATASSKPVADLGLRPHHEHVGQTGIQISPNVYIAIGISGAIQHLAGVSSSKTIIVINKDPEAPFFKAADFGVVGDAGEVLPRLVSAIKEYKAAHPH